MPEVKINTRSPFYIKYQQSSLVSVALDIYIYSGTKTTDKGTAVLSISKKPIGANDYVIFELSQIIKEYLEPTISLPLDSNKNYIKWVQIESTIT